MELSLARLLIDFGLVILIWMVQCIVYPSFRHYSRENLMQWHKRYTRSIGYIVGPLMFMQLALVIYQTIAMFSPFNLIVLMLVVLLWGITYVQFVPRHQAISQGTFDDETLTALVRKNWSRTIIWSVVFLLGLWEYVG